ncbi:hypothetical protein CK203_010005 [Vitis vinifera]|uniref:MADS-box domain-containing protein n=1 Tax=Vitis vinifera TaxID=29760 RepID=A0A438ELV9_VITVI|nr:hypothetical protein CK203_102105 [Vitis vinifera]RVX12965.1 hypothetical protein CK203_010005 [Vitis vinifera]
MVRDKLTMELIADKKSRFRTFRNREKGLKKKLDELSTVKACMMVYGPDGDGPSSSQKKTVALEPQKLQEEIANTKGRTLEGRVDEFSYAELMEIIDQGTGEVEYGLGFSDKGTGTVEYDLDFHFIL